MDLRWPRVYRRSNVGLVVIQIQMLYYDIIVGFYITTKFSTYYDSTNADSEFVLSL